MTLSKRKVYFDILGISPTTDKSVIKKAYRKLALKYHPDISEDSNASNLFIKINEAYEIVSGIRLADRLKNKNKEEKPNPSPEELLAYKLKKARQRYEKIIEEEEASLTKNNDSYRYNEHQNNNQFKNECNER